MGIRHPRLAVHGCEWHENTRLPHDKIGARDCGLERLCIFAFNVDTIARDADAHDYKVAALWLHGVIAFSVIFHASSIRACFFHSIRI